MVHYIFTPWRDRRELLAVRRQFYPRGASSFAAVFTGTDAVESNAVRREAVARVTVWMQRGFCPHMVESTALLAAAILADASSISNSAPVAARAAYASAFARFVTGLLDGQQDRARKMSMHGLAQHIGLPAGFVELRHQVTHEALPSLRRLRSASQQALAWIYDYYWAGVGDAGAGSAEAESAGVANELPGRASLKKALQRYIRSDAPLPSTFIARWGEVRLLSELADLAERLELTATATADDTTRARIRQLSQAVLQWGSTGHTGDTDTAAKPVSRKRPRTEAATPGPALAASRATASAAATTTTAPAKTWTMANLDLAAVRASLARNRQALSSLNTEETTKEKRDVKDAMEVDEAETEQEQDNEDEGNHLDQDDEVEAHEEDSEAEVDVPAKRPRWTRLTGTWTPRPIGVV